MTITLKPRTEAKLVEKARREKPIAQYPAKQRTKRDIPDTWPSYEAVQKTSELTFAEVSD